jgi:lipopolysaccharide export system protein LptA
LKNNKILKFFILIAASILINTTVIFSQPMRGSPTGQPIDLKNADVLLGSSDSGMAMRKYQGRVKFVQGKVVLRCDEAIQYLTGNKVELYGNVTITQEDAVLKSPKIFYDGKTEIARGFDSVYLSDKHSRLSAKDGTYSTKSQIADFFKNVKIISDSAIIDCDTLKYDRKRQESFAKGNVKIETDSAIIYADRANYYRANRESYAWDDVFLQAKFSNIYLTADSVLNKPNEHYAQAMGHPVMFQIDTQKTIEVLPEHPEDTILKITFDTVSISANLIESRQVLDEDRYIFDGNVEIARRRISARADTGFYSKQKEFIYLKGTSIIWYDSTQLHSDSMYIFIPQKKLSLIDAFGKSIAVSRSDTLHPNYKDQIAGEEIKLFFQNDTIQGINSYGGARSLYFMAANDSSDGGGSIHASDSIYIHFDKGEIFDIVWRGAIEAKFLPDRIIDKDPKQYYLPNYIWTDTKPKKKILIFRDKF